MIKGAIFRDGYGDGLCRFWIRRLARTLRTKVRIDPEMNTQAKYEKKRCRCECESVPKAVKKKHLLLRLFAFYLMGKVFGKMLRFSGLSCVVRAFVFVVMMDNAVALSTSASISSPLTTEGKTAVLICPAQFCVPADYSELITSLQKRGIGKCVVADLPRTEWIKVASHLPSEDFLNADLKVEKTLDWYFQGMEKALANIYASEGEVS